MLMPSPNAIDALTALTSQPSNPSLPSPSAPGIIPSRDRFNRAPDSQPTPLRVLPEVDIIIKHPGYEEGENELMLFRGFDRLGETEGLHHGTVLTACRIVSGRDDGFLTEEKSGAPIELSFDDLLLEGRYYYTVPNDDCYAVFPSFEHWPFPHDNLPSTWTKLRKPRVAPLTPMPAQSYTAQAILDRDPTCLLSGLGDIRERAHICPKEEIRWFQANGMRRYNLNRLLTAEARIDDMSNAAAMRSDIHKAYDKRLFVMVPKPDCWTVHFMEPTFHLGSLYHNMSVNLHTDVGLEYMFTRFAWTIFPLIREFLEQGPPRKVRTRASNGSVFQGTERTLDGDAISKTFFPRARSASPKKRKTGGGDDDVMAADQSTAMEHRGRKRRRLYFGGGDVHSEESEGTSEPDPNNHRRASSDQSRSPNSPASPLPSTKRQNCASISSPEPVSSTSLPIDRHQTNKDGCSKTGITEEDPRIQQLYDDEDKYERLRRKELERRRPRYNPGLYCCDYDKHRETVWTAIKGEGPWDAYELCDQCLGGEYLPLATDLDDRL